MPNLFLISDTHFGHEGMCQFCDANGNKYRPFANAQEMDEYMIERWNSTVRPTDKVYHLGDVAIKRCFIKTLAKLNGDKVLIKGNHDIFKLNDYTTYFKDIRATYRLANKLILSHIPLHRGSLSPWKNGTEPINVHGHLHVHDVKINDMPDEKYLNVCVEKIDYTPISLDSVLQIVNKRILDQNQPPVWPGLFLESH